MAAITLDNQDARIAREAAQSQRLLRWALAGSLLIHVSALALASLVHLEPLLLPGEAKIIEVRLVHAPAPQTLIRQHVAPEHVVAPAPPPPAATVKSADGSNGGKPAPSRRPSPSGRAALPKPVPSESLTPRPAPLPRRSPVEPVAPPALAGGGDVPLAAGSRQGDLPIAGASAPGLATGPGIGSDSGSATGLGAPAGSTSGGAGDGRPGSGTGSGAIGGGDGGGGGGTGNGTGTGGGDGSGIGTGPGSGHVSRLADRKIPALVHRVNPVYPVAAQVEGVQGTVKLRVTVTTQGKVDAVKVANSSGDPRLDSAAISAVKKWRYRPAVQDGIPRQVDTYASVTFSLE